MLFSSVNLIQPTAAVRATRQLVTAVLGVDKHPAAVDREHIQQALALACLDLDQADTLLLPITIATGAWMGQDSPAIAGVGNQFIGTQLEALYMPASLLPENQVPFALTAVGTIIPQTVVTADMLALVRFPRKLESAVISTLNGRLFSINNIGTSQTALSGNGLGPTLDGASPDNYGYTLLIAQTNPAQNGVYAFSTNGSTFAFTRPASPEWDWAHQGSTFAILNGNLYGGRFVQLTTPDPISVDVTATAYQTLVSYASNVDAAECAAYIVPRAAGYIVRGVALDTADKNSAANLMAWAEQMLARPLPAASHAQALRIQAATRYSVA
ncbi:MAG TPA: hypothetical protein VGK87_04225 [Anaerolineae bacterium]|jgi:hypothetical protein